jgi:polysaccharide biosynthesis protein PslG
VVAKAKVHGSGRLRALVPALALALAAPMMLAARAAALPANFWGVVPQSTLNAEEFQRLARGGVESVRVSLDWGELQSREGGPVEWGGMDATMERAALAGIAVLPVVTDAPSWAVRSEFVPGSDRSVEAPRNLPVSGAAASAWQSFLSAAVERYGPNGAFWAENPLLPKLPIETWQIWNEPNFKYFVVHPNPAAYGKLVRISSAALRGVDPGAKILLAGMFARPKGARTRSGKHRSPNWFASDFLEQMLRRTPRIGAKFEGVALHPYARYYWELPSEIEELRSVLRRNHDAGKGLWITELGWSSERPSRADLFAKGPGGQATQLRGAFRLLRSRQAGWRLQGIYWFSVDDQPGACNFCGGSGLFGSGFTPKPAWDAYVSFTGGTP